MENGIQHGAATENGLKSPPVDVHIQKCAGDTVIRNGDGPSLEAPNSRRTGRREAREARRSGAAGHHRSHDLNSNSIAEGDDLSAGPKQSEASAIDAAEPGALAAELFDSADKNKDGVLSHSELKNFAQTDEGCKLKVVFDLANQGWADVWKKVDTDQDGKISKDEFVRAFEAGSPVDAPKSRDSLAKERSKAARQDKKLQLRKTQNEKAILEADVDDLKRENRQMAKSLKKEREQRKELNRLSAEKIAVAQGEVAVLRGQCKGLASRIQHIETHTEQTALFADSDHEELANELATLQAYVKENSSRQEAERSTNEQAREQSRKQRDSLEAEKSEMCASVAAAEHRAAFALAKADEAAAEIGDGLRIQLEALIEEIVQAQYDEDCSMERLDLIAKLAMAMQSKLDESTSALQEVGTEPPPLPPSTPPPMAQVVTEAQQMVTDETLRKWRQMRDNGMITQEEFLELSQLSPSCGDSSNVSSPVTPRVTVEKKASKWSWRGGPNKRQEEVAAVVRLAQAQMLEELKYSLMDRESAVHELQERLQEVEAERDDALNRSQGSYTGNSYTGNSYGDFSQRSTSHQRTSSMDSFDFGDLSQGSISPREYDGETLRLQQLNNELCACQEIYLTLPKGTERRALRVRMKELDRQCKHLQAQLNRSPSGVMLSPGTTCSGVSTRGTTPTSSTPTSNEAVLESALMQAEAIAHGLELLPPISDNEKRRHHNHSPKGSPEKGTPTNTHPSTPALVAQTAPELDAPQAQELIPQQMSPQHRRSGSCSVTGTPTSLEQSNTTGAPTTPKGTSSTPATSSTPLPVPKATGWNVVKNAVANNKVAVPILGVAGSRTKAGSLSELIKQRKANKEHTR